MINQKGTGAVESETRKSMESPIRGYLTELNQYRERFLGNIWWSQVLLIATCTTLFIHVSGLLGTRLLAPFAGWGEGAPASITGYADTIPGRFIRWDAGYYLAIARRGYTPDGSERAFFPLYPLLARAFSFALGVSIPWGGLIVSVGCFLGAGFFMYRWVCIDYEDETALLATTFLYIIPMAFFFAAFYAEPVLLLTSVASAYFARRGQFIASGIAIALAGASRGTAFLLGVPYVIEFWQQNDFDRKRWLQFLIGALIAPIGFLAFYQFRGFWIEGGWKTRYAWPWEVLFDGLNAALFAANISPDWFSRALVWQDFLYAVVPLALSIWAFSRIRLSAAIFLLVSILFLWTKHGPYGYAFWSTPRRIAVLYPIYPVLALLVLRLPTRYRWILIGLSVFFLGILSAWFASGRWVA